MDWEVEMKHLKPTMHADRLAVAREEGGEYQAGEKDDAAGEGGDGEGDGPGLLDEEAGAGDDDDDDGQPGEADVTAIVQAVTKQLEERFDSIADRRVNAILKEVRKQQPDPKDKDEGAPRVETGQVDKTAVRAARLAFRDYVGDEIRFLGAEEREFAMELGNSLLQGRDLSDEDRVGRDVAKEVASRVKTIRKLYEDRTVAALKRRGALKEQQGQPLKGEDKGTQATYKDGVERAKQMFGGAE